MLGLHSKIPRLLLGEPVSSPQPFHQIQTEVAAESLLDHLAVSLAAPGRSYLHGAQHFLVDRQRGPHLSHMRIIASLREDALLRLLTPFATALVGPDHRRAGLDDTMEPLADQLGAVIVPN